MIMTMIMIKCPDYIGVVVLPIAADSAGVSVHVLR